MLGYARRLLTAFPTAFPTSERCRHTRVKMLVTLILEIVFLAAYKFIPPERGKFDVQAKDILSPRDYHRFLIAPLFHVSDVHLIVTLVSIAWVGWRLEWRLGPLSFFRLLMCTWLICPVFFSLVSGLLYVLTAFRGIYQISSVGGGPMFFALAMFQSCLAIDDQVRQRAPEHFTDSHGAAVLQAERFYLPFLMLAVLSLLPGEVFFANLCGAVLGFVLVGLADYVLPEGHAQLAVLRDCYLFTLLRRLTKPAPITPLSSVQLATRRAQRAEAGTYRENRPLIA